MIVFEIENIDYYQLNDNSSRAYLQIAIASVYDVNAEYDSFKFIPNCNSFCKTLQTIWNKLVMCKTAAVDGIMVYRSFGIVARWIFYLQLRWWPNSYWIPSPDALIRTIEQMWIMSFELYILFRRTKWFHLALINLWTFVRGSLDNRSNDSTMTRAGHFLSSE